MSIPNTKTPLLDQVDLPCDLRKLDKSQLRQFADELRTDLIDTVSVTGGHFGSSLGVVELTTALHYVFNTPDDRMVWVAMAQMDIRLRRWKDADEALDKVEPLSTKKEDKLYLLFLRGELAERQKRYEPAEQFFRQVLEIDPANAMTLNYLGYMLADKGMRLPEALKMIRKAVDQEPWNGAYLDSLGWVYFKMGEYELAEDNLRQAVARNQTDPTVHEHMGDLYEKTGRIRQAAEQWQLSISEFAKVSPTDVEPGDVAKVQKKLDAARIKLANKDNALGQPKSY